MRKPITHRTGCLAAVLAMSCLMAHAATSTRVVTYDYDADGFLKQQVIEPDDAAFRLTTDWMPDGFGHQKVQVISSGSSSRTSRTEYDPADGRFPVSSTNAAGHVVQYQHDARYGAVSQQIDPNGLVTRYEYDGLGRKVREIRPDNNQTRWDYVLCNSACKGNGVASAFYYVLETPLASDGTTPNGAWRKQYFDALGRLIRSEKPGFNNSGVVVVLTRYDEVGRVQGNSRPYYDGQAIYWTVTEYDALGRTKLVTAPDNSKTTYYYEGLTTRSVNNLNQTTTKVRDSQNRIRQVIDAKGKMLQLAYDPFGNLEITQDSADNRIINKFDTLGRKLSTQDPDMGTWTYEYDGFGQMTVQIDAKGQRTLFPVYDDLGRLRKRQENDLISTWEYDSCYKGIGKLCKSTSDNGYQHTVNYDGLSRPVSSVTVTDTSYTVSNTFDTNGRVDTQTYPTGFKLKYGYDSNGYLAEVKNAQTGQRYWQANSQDAEGHQLLQTYGTSQVVEQRYDDNTGRIRQILAGAGYNLLNLDYQHDTIGNLKSRTDGNRNVVETFLYDELNRINYTQGAGIPTIEYQYDDIGNITYRSDVGNYSYNKSARPHAVSSVVGTVNANFAYDANGNQLNGNNRTIGYTSYNLPNLIQKGSWSDTFLYGPEHQRIKQTNNAGTIYYLNPDNAGGLLFEKEVKTDGTVEYKHYITAAGQTVALYTQRSNGKNELNYWYKDFQGSPTTIADENGNIVERLSYEAFGKRRYPNGQYDPANKITGQITDRGYTGHEHLDEVGLVHMNGRVYDPLLARFVSPDPTVPNAEWMQDFNRYSYVLNNPFAYTDPTGFEEEPVNNDSNLSDPAGSGSSQAGIESLGTSVASKSWGDRLSESIKNALESATNNKSDRSDKFDREKEAANEKAYNARRDAALKSIREKFDVDEKEPKEYPLSIIGKAIAGFAAWGWGTLTNNPALQEAPMKDLEENKGKNVDAFMGFATIKGGIKGGVKGAGKTNLPPGITPVKNAKGEVFKEVHTPPSRSHAGMDEHTHPNYRNVLPDGSVRTGVSNNAVPVSRQDVIDATRPGAQRTGVRND